MRASGRGPMARRAPGGYRDPGPALAARRAGPFSRPNPQSIPTMPRGDKSSYTDKQKRKAEHIEEGYEKRGVSARTAKSRAWATVNKQSGGGKKHGSGRKP